MVERLVVVVEVFYVHVLVDGVGECTNVGQNNLEYSTQKDHQNFHLGIMINGVSNQCGDLSMMIRSCIHHAVMRVAGERCFSRIVLRKISLHVHAATFGILCRTAVNRP